DCLELSALAHGHFRARGPDVVVNAYRSGKVVVQGKGEAAFLRSYGLAAPPAPALPGPTAGSDESGKGDYFGPLTVAAVVVTPGQEAELVRAGVRDSKKMGDPKILRAAAAVRALCPYAVRALDPAEYNQRHDRQKNVALFLSTLHAQAIAEAVQKGKNCRRVVIDQFTFADRLEEALARKNVDLPLEIRPHAEQDPAVAAASVLARAEFLLGLQELGAEHGTELPKGAGPQVERVARELFRAGGLELLRSVAKVHFKTTQRVTGLF
ncbi:MAG: ribonuclease HIII, partial [Planctomycetota bacterium]